MLLRLLLLPLQLFQILVAIQINIIQRLVETQCTLKLLHLEGGNLQVVAEVCEELPYVEQLLKGFAIH